MVTDYASLKTSIAAFLHRTDLTDMIPEFIADAETRIYNDLRVRAMETAYIATMTGGVVDLPAGFIEWQWLYLDASPKQKLERKDMEWITTRYPSATGKPLYFARNGDALAFAPLPDSDYDLIGSYYKRLDALSASNTSNWLTTDNPDLIRYAALCEAAPYALEDARVTLWESKYQAVKARIERTEKREQYSGSRLTATAG